jgi:hypothetical protein
VRIQLDEVTIDIDLFVVIEAVQPSPPAEPSPAEPLRSEPASADSESELGRMRRRYLAKRITVGVMLALLAVLGVTFVGQLLAGHAGSAAASGEYCSIASSDGQVLSFYQTKPGTTHPARSTELWSIMVPAAGDQFIAWWTPEFPYWERANQYAIVNNGGQVLQPFQDVEVLPVWQNPWKSLSETFADYPHLVGGSAVEAMERHLFEDTWRAQLHAATCSS